MRFSLVSLPKMSTSQLASAPAAHVFTAFAPSKLLADVRVIADHFESKAVTTNRMGEFIILSDNYKYLTFNADCYLSRILSVDEVGDTIELLSNNNRRDEFVVYGKDPMKNASINKHLKNMIKKEFFGGSPSGIDILGLFKRKKSARSREKSRKAIENY